MKAPAWLDRSEYPFAPHFLELRAGRLHYVDEGAGEPLVFVHGVPTWSFTWRRLVRELAPRFRCVALDHLGFGLSSRPDPPCTPEHHAAHVAQLIEHLGLRRVTLVVHDWGGPLGLAYALERPENVRRLVVFNTWLWASRGLRAGLTARLLASPLYRVLETRWNVTARFFVVLAAGNRASLPPSVRRHYVEPLRRPADRTAVWTLVRAIHRAGPWLDGLWARRDRLAALPALVLWGLRDPAFTRADLERWQAALPRAAVHALDRAGHFPHEELHAEVVALLERFLADGNPDAPWL